MVRGGAGLRHSGEVTGCRPNKICGSCAVGAGMDLFSVSPPSTRAQEGAGPASADLSPAAAALLGAEGTPGAGEQRWTSDSGALGRLAWPGPAWPRPGFAPGAARGCPSASPAIVTRRRAWGVPLLSSSGPAPARAPAQAPNCVRAELHVPVRGARPQVMVRAHLPIAPCSYSEAPGLGGRVPMQAVAWLAP